MKSNPLPHKIPKDLQLGLSSPDLQTLWLSLTPLARNEWMCWIENAKKVETRLKRIDRTKSSLREGKRRPCCWMGCPHRV